MAIDLEEILSSITAYSLPEHRDSPLVIRSAKELATAVDELVGAGNEYCSYMSVFVDDPAGVHSSYLGIGVDSDRGCGSILFQGEDGEYYSRGTDTDCIAVCYFDFGNERTFPGNSQIEIGKLKQALIEFYDGHFRRPATVKWQVWAGLEEDAGDVSNLHTSLIDPWSS
ncbi:Imm1 family immunity protein [Nocardia sp. NPDC058658]|uniref:Imm1 family immunity protein n=1 Tax=Nocardia sp. NPDC058658 TaxID=3346580 RepID=UPI00366196B6